MLINLARSFSPFMKNNLTKEGYSAAARLCSDLGWHLFKVRPKLHLLVEIWILVRYIFGTMIFFLQLPLWWIYGFFLWFMKIMQKPNQETDGSATEEWRWKDLITTVFPSNWLKILFVFICALDFGSSPPFFPIYLRKCIRLGVLVWRGLRRAYISNK